MFLLGSEPLEDDAAAGAGLEIEGCTETDGGGDDLTGAGAATGADLCMEGAMEGCTEMLGAERVVGTDIALEGAESYPRPPPLVDGWELMTGLPTDLEGTVTGGAEDIGRLPDDP